jgi:predicted transglutaminase-like cysteine proteinase
MDDTAPKIPPKIPEAWRACARCSFCGFDRHLCVICCCLCRRFESRRRSAQGFNADPDVGTGPAKFFTINGVLAKLDRAQGRGKDAIRLVSLKSSNTVTDARPSLAEVPARGAEPFGLFTFRAPEGLLSRKWRGLQSDFIKEEKVLERCRDDASDCPSYAAQFLRLINAVKSKSGRAQLEEANRGVNAAIRFVSDYAQYGEADRWSAPLATFATAKGDCGDYAFAKYIALRAAGFPSDDLRVVMGRDRTLRQDHAILAARLDGRWLVLDSQTF